VAPYRIESTGLPGFDPRQLELVALIARTRPGRIDDGARHAMKRLIDSRSPERRLQPRRGGNW